MFGKSTTATLPLTVALASWLGGCGSPDSPRDLTTLQDSTAIVNILESAATCGSCITVDRVVTLGDTIEPGYIDWSIYAAVDDLGNYWVGMPRESVVKVWDAEGSFLRQVGRRGDGPMEFRRPAPVGTDGEGRMRVVDLANGRETVVNADFSYHSDRSLFPGSYQVAVPLRADGRYLVNTSRTTAGSEGVPLHIVEGLDILHSFDQMEGIEGPGFAPRVLAVDREARIYSAREVGDYLIRVWSESGARILGLRGPRLNEREASRGAWSPDNPPYSRIFAMQVDGEHRLWVLAHVRRDDWLDHLEERVMPNGGIAHVPTDDDWGYVFESRIDLIDLNSGSFIATRRHDALLEAFVGDGLVIETVENERAYPQLVVWRLGFDSSR